MFLFAYLTVENLLAQCNVRYFKQELKETIFPKKLEEAYVRNLHQTRTIRLPRLRG
jgi:hypothetical protein